MDKYTKRFILIEIYYLLCFLTWCFVETYGMDTIWTFIKENPTLIVGIGTMLATLAYAIITYSTLHEMKKQREATYQPDLVVENGYLKFEVERIDPFNRKPIYKFNYLEGQGLEVPDHNNIYIRLINLGCGTAQHIKAELECVIPSFKNFADRINRNLFLNREQEVGFTFLEESYNYKYTYPFGFESVSGGFTKRTTQFSYLLPIETSKHLRYVELASPYETFLNLYLNLCYAHYLIYDSDLWEPIFEFDLKLSYEDMGKKCIQKQYKITLFNQGITPSGMLLFLGSELIN